MTGPPRAMDEPIRIRGARQHNLKGIDLDLPRRALTVITGPSGSGKSSLALDTLFAAGQRRYVEALSTYAKQFLDRLDKPDVDRIEGLPPAVAIEQRNPATSSRSTVGTATEVYDYLRLLFARAGRTHCPDCGDEVRPDTVGSSVDRVAALPPGTRFMVAFPLRRSGKVSHRQVAENLRALGFARVLADGVPAELEEVLRDAGPEAEQGPETEQGPEAEQRTETEPVPDLAASREVMVVVDRMKVPQKADRTWSERLADSLATCFREGEGEAAVIPAEGREAVTTLHFTEAFRCPNHPERVFLQPEPKLFSFNNPYGSCPACTGFGATLEYDPDLIVPDPGRSVDDGAVDPWAKPRYGRERAALRRFAIREGVSSYTPWRDLPASFREAVLYGKGSFGGVMGFLVSREPKRYKQYIRIFLRQYQRPLPCRACGGSRLRPEAGHVTVGGTAIGSVSDMPIEELPGWLAGLALRPMEEKIAGPILRELAARTGFLVDVGLGYLTLGRQVRTLSGGEAQRISLANSLGSRLVDTLYVLDEPSVGLHPRDIEALLALLRRLRDGGNTVVVVEHNATAIQAADHVVELGPASGDQGGEVVFEGSPEVLADSLTNTGQYLSQNMSHHNPKSPNGLSGKSRTNLSRSTRRPVDGARIRLDGASLHNLRAVEAEFPVGVMTVVTGVSGSGKSTLVHDILYRALERELRGGQTSAKEHLGEAVGSYNSLTGLEHVDDVVLIDQSPIGRTPRSNPVTYIRAWGEIRRIFASEPAARKAGLEARSFSFNVKGGRCEECAGAGSVRVEMVFMADIHVPCEVCGGKRYGPDVLEVRFRGHNVTEVLDFTVDRAMRFFLREPKLGQALWHLQQVGLGYLRLGQPAPQLSGGEAQRLKIARELIGAAGRKGGRGRSGRVGARGAGGRNRAAGGMTRTGAAAASRKLYILDEPTTGLSGPDVAQLLRVLRKLVRAGNTLVVVEHDLDVIRAADWVVDLGPGAGMHGGEVVAMGRPEDVATVPESVTGRFLGTRGDEPGGAERAAGGRGRRSQGAGAGGRA